MSSADHLRPLPSSKDGITYDYETISNGLSYIREFIIDFDYDSFIKNHTLDKMITLYENETNDYSKLILFRGIDSKASFDTEIEQPVLFNFISSTFHVESMYFYSIKDLSTLPQYIIDLCNQLVNELEKQIICRTK